MIAQQWSSWATRFSAVPAASVAIAVVLAGAVAATAGPSHAAARHQAKVNNPYAGARVYVNPEWSALAAGEPGGHLVADQPTAVRLDRIAAIDGADDRMGLREHLDEALRQGADLIQLVLHNLPGRDCERLASTGELAYDELPRYRAEFVDPISQILADPAYARLRIVTIIEPNSLANLVTHTSPRPDATFGCDQVLAYGSYPLGIGYALAQLGPLPNVYPYLDVSHPGQLGRSSDLADLVSLLEFAADASGATPDLVHGFIANVGNYSVLREKYFRTRDVINGEPVRTHSSWVAGRDFVDVLPYLAAMRHRLTAAGFPRGAGMLVDTSRNGWGGPERPSGPGPRTSAEEYVEAGRLDRRAQVTTWCNQTDAGIGVRPVAAPASGIDAYVWATAPGTSDGSGTWGNAFHPYEPRCHPDYAGTDDTGALPGAPPAGDWFPAYFQRLLANAWPPLATGAAVRGPARD
ncbi:glycoside hydrolase family 6 protein [Solwaraspora sp. WMMD791]|uniref:glycoside hydrolase family 6 protein n=1 Tax=Solwaraspora sp. WMMD791 TaxID=3016086 RepID=UPI00249CAA07|nr:glycoside hydrolase family 6 protein [Solwaraspora sp. WMMD791]WFE30335.1 glycoside hydrolase family 6 protein [Solwaraspora sp. WMMD791]